MNPAAPKISARYRIHCSETREDKRIAPETAAPAAAIGVKSSPRTGSLRFGRSSAEMSMKRFSFLSDDLFLYYRKRSLIARLSG